METELINHYVNVLQVTTMMENKLNVLHVDINAKNVLRLLITVQFVHPTELKYLIVIAQKEPIMTELTQPVKNVMLTVKLVLPSQTVLFVQREE
jgi:hypothetical protein